MDTKKRTALKTLTFKILTTGVTYMITHNLAGALMIHAAMTLCFIGHERIWNMVKWGKKLSAKADVGPTH